MEPEDLLRYAADVCDRLGLTYLVTGSTATIAYGEPRFTNDIDIVIDLPGEKVEAFCDAFPLDEFHLDRETVRTAVQNGAQFNLIHPAAGLKIDFIVLTQSDFNQSRVTRRRELPVLADRNVSFASPEDVILMKMIYYREGKSEKHLRDIGGVLRVQSAAIDRLYIAQWAESLDVGDIWQTILNREAR
ncbi:MAG: hypothetical protein IID45_09155 [Planctomycetes bacterium]|nr:hypothetical protein [Planctomycetota bacterium]